MAEPETRSLHIAMFPWLAFGHMIPFLELSKLIAEKGHRISFISTPRNIHRLPKLPPHLAPLINFVPLPLPPHEKLPENAEATMDIPLEAMSSLKVAYDGLEESITEFLKTSDVDWIVYDFVPYWLPQVAAKLGISRAFFSIFAAVMIAFMLPSLSGDDDPRREAKDFTSPPPWVTFPSKVAFHLFEAKKILDHVEENDSGVSDVFRGLCAIRGCDVVIIRSSFEFESDWLRLLGNLHGKPVLPVGLLPPPMQQQVPGQEHDKDGIWLQLRDWLDKFVQGSVVYVAFGSEIRPSKDDLIELALGLEQSKLPFLWALRKLPGDDDEEEDENGIAKFLRGFEERNREVGLVWRSWAPQVKILSHKSIGAFLTHCGLTSIVEVLALGKPIAMFPYSYDQGLTARLLEPMGVGEPIPRDEEDGKFTGNSVAKTLRMVINDEQHYREKAKAASKIFANEKLQGEYIDKVVGFLQEHRLSVRKN